MHGRRSENAIGFALQWLNLQSDDLGRRGLRARILADVAVSSSAQGGRRRRELPAGGPGVLISAPKVLELVATLRDQGEQQAIDLFIDLFAEAYGFPPELIELEHVHWLKTWSDGEREPSGGTSTPSGQ